MYGPPIYYPVAGHIVVIKQYVIEIKLRLQKLQQELTMPTIHHAARNQEILTEINRQLMRKMP